MPQKTSTPITRAWRSAVVAAATSALLLSGAATVSAAPLASQSETTASAAVRKVPVVKTASSPVGTILVDGKGRTIYIFAADSKGKSACNAACLEYWPAVIAPASLPTSVAGVTGKLGVLKRAGGVRQLTINGWPLYTYKGDASTGAISGQGVNASGAKWWVVSPSGARITKMPSSTSTGPSTPTPPSNPGYDY
jgi:predicted lipoprotein with Yx(FWY)xxD motif